MPTYEYECKDCRHHFRKVLHIEEHDTYTPQCPKCKSKNVAHVLTPFYAQTSKKS